MKKKIKEIKENKILKIVGNILYTVLFLIVLLMLLVVVLQRTSNNNIALGGFRIFTVATGSMEPKYNVGDVLISKEIEPEKLKKEDDIVYVGKEGGLNGKIITHQIIDIQKENENYKITTKGIANDIEDPKINETQVLGKVIYKVKTLSLLRKLSNNIYIFFFLIFIPVVIFIFKKIFYIATDDGNEEDDEDNEHDKDKDD